MKLFNTSKYFAATAVMMIASLLFSLNTKAQGTAPIDGDGDGRFEISTKNHLLFLSENPNADLYADYEQTGDIVFTGADFQPGGGFYNDGKGFSPIGNSGNYFRGNYFGQNFVIDGLYINRPLEDNIGLFGYIAYSNLENIRLSNANITGRNYVGGLAGKAGGSSATDYRILNCIVKGTVVGEEYVAGVVGSPVYIKIIRTAADVSVSGIKKVGGMAGANGAEISHCYVKGNVAGENMIGGFVGVNSSLIEKCFSVASVTGDTYTGGFAGMNSSIQLYNSFWDTEASGQPSTTGSRATGKTTSEMKEILTYTDLNTEGLDEAWDFKGAPNDDNQGEDHWMIIADQNDGYPTFSTPGVAPVDNDGDGRLEIASKENLLYLSQNVYANYRTNYEQVNHIAFTDADFQPGGIFYNDGAGFSPIGSEKIPFKGSYFGQEYFLENLQINRPGSDFVGFFGYLKHEGAQPDSLKDIHLREASIIGKDYVGVLSGYNQNTVVLRCYSTGEVNGTNRVGGLLGYNYAKVAQCYSKAFVSGDNQVGGLIGEKYYTAIWNCYSTGFVTGINQVGGLIGFNRGYVNGWGHSYYSKVYKAYASGYVTGHTDVGGMVGKSFVGLYYDCFFNNQATGQTASAGGTGKSNAAMKDVATFTSLATSGLDEAWDFKNNPNDDNNSEDVWKMELSGELNNGYPILAWQEIPLTLPTISTLSMWSVSSTTALARGLIIDQGNPNPTQHGVCYNRTGNPTLEDFKTEQGPIDNSPVMFLAPIEDLLPDRTYYLKAYAINDVDTVFGEEVSFTTDIQKVYFGGSFTVEDKPYDATADAVIAENNLVVNGAVDGDDVVFENVIVEYASADAGNDIEVNIVDAELAGDDSEHYEFHSWAFDNALSSTGNIIKREITVVADDKEREQCAENPEFTFAYSGFLDGEDESVLTNEPSVSCIADGSSLPGEYDITLSGGEDENYAFSYMNGTLTIIEDITSPVAVAQNMTVELDASGQATITAEEVDNGSYDNCTITNRQLDMSDFDCSDIGENTVTLTVTDAAGNESTETAVITVEDNLAPMVITQDITIALNGDGEASITTDDINNGSSDNCSVDTYELDITTFDCASVGENVVTLTLTDPSGNTSSATANVTVEDNIDPVALTQDMTLDLDATGNASITPEQIDNGSSDNCGIADLSLDMTAFTCSDIGEQQVALTVIDPSGNQSQASAVVTVQDNSAPTVLTKDITVELDASGQASITPEDINNGSFDNCTIDSYYLDITAFDCSDVGTQEVTLTVTDVNGNEASALAYVTVEDNISPTVFTQDTLVELNPSGQASITALEINDGSFDNCAIDSYVLDQSEFDETDIGENIITLTVTDIHGNATSETAIVTIADNTPPTIITQPVTLYLDMNGEATLTPGEVDNGSYDNVEITGMEIDMDYFACGDEGEHMVTLTATDISGNTSSATETVTVLDTITPSGLQVNTMPMLCYGINEAQIEIVPEDGFGEMAFSIDNGATWQHGDGLFADLTSGTYNIVVESANGCLVYHDENPIVFEEPEELVINELEVSDATCFGAANGMIDVEAAGGTGAHYFSADGGATWQEGHLLYGLAAGSYEVMVMDDNGCVTPYAQNPVVINEPEALVYEQVILTDAMCNGTANAAIEIIASGGTGTIEYSIGDDLWPNDGLFEGLEAAEYELRIRDDRNCLNIYDDNPVILNEPEALVIDEVTSTDVNCYEGADGTIEFSTSGGTGAHQFSIDGGASWQSENAFTNLEQGSYELLVKDENECITLYANNPVTIEQPEELIINQVTVEDLTCFGSDDGQISIEATGGTGVIHYAINNQWQTESEFTSLAPGGYEVEVKDENECLAVYVQNPVTITEPEAIDVSITASADTAMVDETIILTAESNYSGAECYWEPLGIFGEQVEVSEQLVGEYEYTVTASNENGCEATDTKVLVFTINTAVSGATHAVQVVVMPNPTNGKFSVHVDGMPEKYALFIYNSNGGLIAERLNMAANQTKHHFDLTKNTAGTYFLRIVCGHNQWVRKIILDH